jgi:hypothetical protein
MPCRHLSQGKLILVAKKLIVMVAMNPRVVGRLTLPRVLFVVGWLATAVMMLAALDFFGPLICFTGLAYGGLWPIRGFRNRQGVHVGAQPQTALALADRQRADDARARHACRDLVSQLCSLSATSALVRVSRKESSGC